MVTKCLHCKEIIDTSLDNYIFLKTRYVHIDCRKKYLKKLYKSDEKVEEVLKQELIDSEDRKNQLKKKDSKNEEKEKKEITKVETETTKVEKKTPKNKIKKCLYCGKEIDITRDEYAKPRVNRYAHLSCYQENYNPDEEYIDKIYSLLTEVGLKYDYQQCEKQRISFIKKMGYTNNGIYLTLKYYYYVKKSSISKSEGRIGIVPYIYDEAVAYYKNLEKEQKIIGNGIKKQLQEKSTIIVVNNIPNKNTKRKYINLDEIGGV